MAAAWYVLSLVHFLEKLKSLIFCYYFKADDILETKPDTRASKSSNPSTEHDSERPFEFVSMVTLTDIMQMQE